MSKYQITETSASKWQLYFRDQRNDFVADKFNGKLVQTMGICQKGVYTVSLEEGIYLLELDRASIINKEEFNLKFIDLMKHNRVNLSKIKTRTVLNGLGFPLIQRENRTFLHKPDQNFRKTSPPKAKGIIINASASDHVFDENILKAEIGDIPLFYSINDMNTQLFTSIKWISLNIDESLTKEIDPFAFLKNEAKF